MPYRAARTLQPDRQWILLLFAILATTFIVYYPGLHGPFLLDDDNWIPNSEVPLSVETLLDQLDAAGSVLGVSRGLTLATFQLTASLSGTQSYAFKYQNLLIHLINGLLVFWLLLLLHQASSAYHQSHLPLGLSAGAFAFGVTALWLLHPLQVSTVLYAVQRLVLLASLFLLAALICYVKARTLVRTMPATGLLLGLGSIALFATLGFLSKEIAALLPLLILTVEWFVFRFKFDSRRESLAVHTILVCTVIVPIVLAALWLFPRLDGLLGWHPGRGFSGTERLLTEVHVLLHYLKLFFVPIPGTMSLFHDTFPITHHLDVATTAIAAAYAVAIVGAIAVRNHLHWIGFGVVWFFIFHTLESTIIQLELVFEHRNYLAILGLCIATVAGTAQVLSRFRLRRLAYPAFAAALLLLLLNTAARASIWSDLEGLLASDFARRPNSPWLLSELATLESSRGNQAIAIAYLNQLLALNLEDAGPELGALRLFCRQPAVPEILLQRTERKVREGRLSPFTVDGLGRLVDQTLRGHCPAVKIQQLLQLTADAADNHNARSADQRCIVGEMQTRVLIEMQSWPAAYAAWDAALHRCLAASPPQIRHAVENPLRFAQALGYYDATIALARSVTNDPRHRRTLNRGYASRGGFEFDAVAGTEQSKTASGGTAGSPRSPD